MHATKRDALEVRTGEAANVDNPDANSSATGTVMTAATARAPIQPKRAHADICDRDSGMDRDATINRAARTHAANINVPHQIAR